MSEECEKGELGIEQGLLGAILGASVDDDASRIMGVYEKAGVKPEWFTSFETKHLWECIADEWRRHRTVDAYGIAAKFGKDGAKVVSEMIASGAESSHAEYYASRMRDRETYKALFKACRDTLQEANADNAAQKAEELAAKVRDIQDFAAGGDAALMNLGSFMAESVRRKKWLSEQRFVRKNWMAYDGLPMPWGILNTYYTGMKTGLHIVAALPSNGKTTFGVNLSLFWLKMGIRHGFVCIDMPGAGLCDRYACLSAQISLHKLNFGASPKEVEEFADEMKELCAMDAVTVSEDDTVSKIEYEVTRGVSSLGWKAVIIDYLQLVDPELPGNVAPYIKAMTATKAMKRLAKRLKIPVVCLVQLSNTFARDERSGSAKIPALDHLGDTSEIGRAAATVAVIMVDKDVKAHWNEYTPWKLCYGDPDGRLNNDSRLFAKNDEYLRGQKSIAEKGGLRPIYYAVIKNQQGNTGMVAMVMYSKYFMIRPGDQNAEPLEIEDAKGKKKKINAPLFETICDDWMYNPGDEILEKTGGIGTRWIRYPGETIADWKKRVAAERERHHSTSGRYDPELEDVPYFEYEEVDQNLPAMREDLERAMKELEELR